MSYESGVQQQGVYTAMNTPAGIVDASPEYSTLGSYYTKQCTFPTMPGQVPAQCVTISPVWGGTGYRVLQNNLPPDRLQDGNYFTLSTAYPSFPNTACMRPLVN